MRVTLALRSLIPTLLPEGEGLFIPRPSGEGSRVREVSRITEKPINSTMKDKQYGH